MLYIEERQKVPVNQKETPEGPLRRALVILIMTALTFGVGAADRDHFYLGLGLGKNGMWFSGGTWEDQGSLGCGGKIGYRHHIAGNWYGDANFSHYSQCFVGAPWNDEDETESDHLFYFFEYRIY